MNRNERMEWVKTLKPGDDVAYQTGRTSKRHEITKVLKITPTGKIRTENGKLFDNTGYCRNSDTWTPGLFLKPITQVILDERRRLTLLSKITRVNLSQFTTDQLEKIWQVMNGESEA